MEQKQENTVVKIFEASTEPAADHTYIYIYTLPLNKPFSLS